MPLQRKDKVKLGKYFNKIIEIAGNRPGKDLKCHLQTLSTTDCEKQEDSGHF